MSERGVDSHPLYSAAALDPERERAATKRAVLASEVLDEAAKVADALEPTVTTTVVVFTLDELTLLRSGFHRITSRDDRLYNKLKRAEKRLAERLGK